MSPQTSARKTLLTRTRRIAQALEETLGLPVQSRALPPPLDMLIATILSQNTNDRNSHRAYTALRKRYPSWEDVARAPVRTLVATIRSGGMANQKAARIKGILKAVKEKYGSHDLSALRGRPNEEVIEELTQLKGVGSKTAACVLVFSLGRDVFPVDTHVHRLCGRLGLTPGSRTPEETYGRMKDLVPEGKGYSFHTNLIRFGRKICHSQRPACGICPLQHDCYFEEKERYIAGTRKASAVDHSFMLLDNITE